MAKTASKTTSESLSTASFTTRMGCELITILLFPLCMTSGPTYQIPSSIPLNRYLYVVTSTLCEIPCFSTILDIKKYSVVLAQLIVLVVLLEISLQ